LKLKYNIQGAGEAVILIHGLFGSKNNLARLGGILSKKYMVISPDLRNHGESPRSKGMNYRLMATDIIDLMDDLGLSQASLVGHSMGGKIAMQAALNYAYKFKKIVVGDILPINYDPNLHRNTIDGLNAIISGRPSSRKQAHEILLPYVNDLASREFLLKNLVLKKNGEYGIKIYMESINANYSNELTKAPYGKPFTGPTLFIKGGNSQYIKSKYLNETSRLFPKCQHEIIDGAGHWLHIEKSAEFNKIILDFLRV
jgi:esterase